MRETNALLRTAFVGWLVLAGLSPIVLAQDQGRMTIQATAKGTSTQLGRMVDVNIYIEAYSTDDDRQTLINALSSVNRTDWWMLSRT